MGMDIWTYATSVVDTMIDISFSMATSSIQIGVFSSSLVFENVVVIVSKIGSCIIEYTQYSNIYAIDKGQLIIGVAPGLTHSRRQFVHFAQRQDDTVAFGGRRRVHDALLKVEHFVGELFRDFGHRAEVDGKVAQQHFVRGYDLHVFYRTD